MRRSDPPLEKLLFDEPYLFDFFQAVRLLENREGRGPVGHDVAPSREAVRFTGHLSLNFPPSPIYSLDEIAEDSPRNGGPPRMSTPFMGLIGASGVLPTVYTEALIALKSKKRNAPALDFLDLFHHRLVSLFYRAWEKYNVPTLWERGNSEPSGEPGTDPFSKHLFDLIGLGSTSPDMIGVEAPPLRNRQAVSDATLVYYTGFFAQQHRPTVSLELLLEDHFGQTARVISFVGQWLRLEEDQQSRMGRRGSFNRLGIDTVAGRKVWDDQSKFRVRFGPLSFEDFRDFLPGGRLADELMDLIRFFVRGELDFDVQLVLRASDVPWCRLSRDPRTAAQLGRTSWLKTRDFARDADDSIARASAQDRRLGS